MADRLCNCDMAWHGRAGLGWAGLGLTGQDNLTVRLALSGYTGIKSWSIDS